MAALTEAERALVRRDRAVAAALRVLLHTSRARGRRPIGQSLVDSPAGLLAWIVKSFQDWTDPAAKLPEDAVDRDRILTDVSMNGRTERFNGHVGAQGALYCATAVAVFTTRLPPVRRQAEQCRPPG